MIRIHRVCCDKPFRMDLRLQRGVLHAGGISRDSRAEGEPVTFGVGDIVKCCVLKTFGTRFAGLFKKAFSLAEGDRGVQTDRRCRCRAGQMACRLCRPHPPYRHRRIGTGEAAGDRSAVREDCRRSLQVTVAKNAHRLFPKGLAVRVAFWDDPPTGVYDATRSDGQE